MTRETRKKKCEVSVTVGGVHRLEGFSSPRTKSKFALQTGKKRKGAHRRRTVTTTSPLREHARHAFLRFGPICIIGLKDRQTQETISVTSTSPAWPPLHLPARAVAAALHVCARAWAVDSATALGPWPLRPEILDLRRQFKGESADGLSAGPLMVEREAE